MLPPITTFTCHVQGLTAVFDSVECVGLCLKQLHWAVFDYKMVSAFGSRCMCFWVCLCMRKVY